MSFCGSNGNNGFNGGRNGLNGTPSLVRHINEFVGETVTIFCTVGGVAGCGFTGVVLAVSPCFVRLVTEQGIAPANPIAENICGDFDNGPGRGCGGLGNGNHNGPTRIAGSVCDIPIDKIAAFCHNAV